MNAKFVVNQRHAVKRSKNDFSSPKIGLALGSGSARGWSHIGVLEALLEEGIRPNIVCGCSMGAFVGSAYVADKLDYLKEWSLDLTRTKLIKLMDLSIASGGLIKGDLITDFLREIHGDKDITEYSTPFAAVSTELLSGREIWLQEGPMHQAVRASISLPGIFTPAKVGGVWLMDGGLVNPVPVSLCRALGADIIIAVNLNNDLVGRRVITQEMESSLKSSSKLSSDLLDKLPDQIPKVIKENLSKIIENINKTTSDNTPGYFDVLFNSLNIMQDRITRSRLAGEPPHVMLLPRLSNFNLMDFHRAEEAIKEGRACVQESLPMIRKLLQK